MSHNIKNIIFDLGNVLLPVDPQHSQQAFTQLGEPDFLRLFTLQQQVSFLDDFERNHISPEQFRQQLRMVTGITASDQEIDQAWNAMLGEFPQSSLDLLQNLKPHYRLFLYSNTNILHMESLNQQLQKTYRLESLAPLFEKDHYSYTLGERKPDAAGFQAILSQHDLKASETLFIDDNLANVDAAQKLGLQILQASSMDEVLVYGEKLLEVGPR